MKIISAHNGLLQTLAGKELRAAVGRSFQTGIDLLDELAPSGQWSSGTIHELLTEPAHGTPRFFATMIARGVTGAKSGDLSFSRGACPARELVCGITSRAGQAPRLNGKSETRVTSQGVIVWSDPQSGPYPPRPA